MSQKARPVLTHALRSPKKLDVPKPIPEELLNSSDKASVALSKAKIMKNVERSHTERLGDFLANFESYIDEPATVLKSASYHSKPVRNTFYFTNSKIQGPDDMFEVTPRSTPHKDYQEIEVLEAGKHWALQGILLYVTPKNEFNEDNQVILPSGIEENEDITFLETDSLVNVAPSRMSTRVDRKVISGDNWSKRLDMLLLQAFKQFPDNWQKVSRVLGQKKSPIECRDRHKILSSLRIEGHFTVEEDQILRNAITKYGKAYALIAKKCFKGRTAKQLRDRYINSIAKESQKVERFELKEQQTCQPSNPLYLISPKKCERDNVVIRVSSFRRQKHCEIDEEQGTLVEEVSHEASSDDESRFNDITVKNYHKESISVSAFKE